MMKKIAAWPHLATTTLVAAIGLYASLTIFQINRWSIWFDEAFSAYLTRYNFAELTYFTALDVHPPLYYWVLKVWVTFFGTSDIALRSLSLTFGIVAIVLAFVLMKKLFGTRAACLSVLFLAVLPVLVRYGQEARMYTMVVSLALAATYVFVRAHETNQRKYWLGYALLIALGMWTHYFMALVWLSHWLWRVMWVRQQKTKQSKVKAYFSKEWVLTHVGAVALFMPWLPWMAMQLTTIQQHGFWIAPVTPDSLTNFFTTFFFFREHHATQGWYALVYYIALATFGYLFYQAYRRANKKQRLYLQLIAAVAVVPLVLMIVASLPPLRPAFVERYVGPSFIFMALLLALVISLYSRSLRPRYQIIIPVFFVGVFLSGVVYAQTLGNFNKNSNLAIETKQVVERIRRDGVAHEPIVAISPWVYYEASAYEKGDSPVYYLDTEAEAGDAGSLAMLQAPNPHKIEDLGGFARQHDTLWIMSDVYDGDSLEAPVEGWQELQRFSVNDPQTGKERYQAVRYSVR